MDPFDRLLHWGPQRLAPLLCNTFGGTKYRYARLCFLAAVATVLVAYFRATSYVPIAMDAISICALSFLFMVICRRMELAERHLPADMLHPIHQVGFKLRRFANYAFFGIAVFKIAVVHEYGSGIPGVLEVLGLHLATGVAPRRPSWLKHTWRRLAERLKSLAPARHHPVHA